MPGSDLTISCREWPMPRVEFASPARDAGLRLYAVLIAGVEQAACHHQRQQQGAARGMRRQKNKQQVIIPTKKRRRTEKISWATRLWRKLFQAMPRTPAVHVLASRREGCAFGYESLAQLLFRFLAKTKIVAASLMANIAERLADGASEAGLFELIRKATTHRPQESQSSQGNTG